MVDDVGEPDVGRWFAPYPRRRSSVDDVIVASLKRYGTEIPPEVVTANVEGSDDG